MPKSKLNLLPDGYCHFAIWKQCHKCKSKFGSTFIQKWKYISAYHIDGKTGELIYFYATNYVCGKCKRKIQKDDEDLVKVMKYDFNEARKENLKLQ
jgi:hypothetical protein